MDEPQDRPLWQRLGWMFAIWLAQCNRAGTCRFRHQVLAQSVTDARQMRQYSYT